MNSLAPKLVVLAALLSAVAFAAPRGMVNEAEATELVQTTTQMTASKVVSLKKQFATLQAQLQSGAKVTPGVAGTIQRLITMVDTEIFPAINEAHAEDQRELESAESALLELNKAWIIGRTALLSDASDIRDDQTQFNVDVGEWKAATEAYDLSKEVYLTTYRNMTETCCEKDHAGVVDVVYTDAYHACDFTNDATSANCVSAADDSIAAKTVDHFAAGKAKYDDLFTRCNNLIEDFRLADEDLKAKDMACDTKRDEAKNLEEKIGEDRATFDPMWAGAVSFYNGNWTSFMNHFTGTLARVKHDEGDRHQEFQACKEIRCMLASYQTDGTFTEGAMATCSATYANSHLHNVYPATPVKEHTDLPAWVVMDSYAAFERACESENVPVRPEIPCESKAPLPQPSCTNHI